MDGTILVGTAPSSFSRQDQSSFTPGILGVNPSTGTQIRLSMGQLLSVPTYIAQAPNEQLYVTDLTAFGSGAVIQIDSNTGQQTLIAKGGFINGPNVLVFMNGFLYVANEGDSSGNVHNIVQINPNTGQQRLITSGGGFSVPTGMAPGPGNNVYVVDEPGNVQGADPGSIWLVDLDTGQQTLVAHGGLLDHPQDVVVDANGNLIVGNTGRAPNYLGSVIRINPQTGVQTVLAWFGNSTGLDSVELAADGTIYVGAISNGVTPGKIYAVDPTTGAQRTISSGRNLSLTEGIRVFHVTAAAAERNTGTPNQRFVQQLYFDLLRRPVDPAGLASWTGWLDRGLSRTQVVTTIQNSAEYHSLVVGDLYQLVLERPVDSLGQATWVNFLSRGGTAAQLEAILLGSDEFFARHGNSDGFLPALYQVLLQRSIDPIGAQFWGQVPRSTASARQAVAAGMLTSVEADRLQVQSLYLEYLHRPADAGGLDIFTTALARGFTSEEVAVILLSSGEYFAGV
jgi:hypothetical protein